MSPLEYVRAGFDPDVVGPPGTCWLFTIADVDLACGVDSIPGAWWIQFILAAGFYVWTVPVRWIRANVMGTIGDDETFVHALSLNAGSDTSWVDSTQLHDIAIIVAAAFDAFMAANAFMFTVDVVYKEVGCSLLQQTSVGGDIDTILTSEFAPIGGEFGEAGSEDAVNRLPNETSMAISWETGTRGKRGRGRTYLPPMAKDTISDGRFTSARCGAIANYAVETLIPALQISGSGWSLAVRSGADLALYDVTGARVSDVPDAQRRRRRSQVPTWHEGS